MAEQEPDGAAPRQPGGGWLRRELGRQGTAVRDAAYQGVDSFRRTAREMRGRRVFAVTAGRPRDDIAATVNFEEVDVSEALIEATGGRGPDVCIEAVGMEASGNGLHNMSIYDRAKQALRMETDRAVTLRQAIHACRKGGTVSVLGVFGGFVDKFPMGAVMNKGLTVRSGQQHGQRYIPMLLDRVANGDFDPSYLATHHLPLTAGGDGYEMFKHKEGGRLRVVFSPS